MGGQRQGAAYLNSGPEFGHTARRPAHPSPIPSPSLDPRPPTGAPIALGPPRRRVELTAPCGEACAWPRSRFSAPLPSPSLAPPHTPSLASRGDCGAAAPRRAALFSPLILLTPPLPPPLLPPSPPLSRGDCGTAAPRRAGRRGGADVVLRRRSGGGAPGAVAHPAGGVCVWGGGGFKVFGAVLA